MDGRNYPHETIAPMNGDAHPRTQPPDALWASGMRGAVAALALGLAQEADREAPAWARAWLAACDPEPTIKRILNHRIADVTRPVVEGDERLSPWADSLNADMRRTRLNSMALVAGLKRASDALKSEGVPHLLVKGPALAAQTADDWATRRSVDLDVLVDLHDVSRVERALGSAGFTQRRGFAPGPQSPLFAPAAKWLQELAFSSSSQTIDVHWRLDPSRGCLTWDFQDLWQRRALVEVAGTDVDTLSPVDAALFNAVHAGKDCWSSLHLLRDHARLVATAGLSQEGWNVAATEASCLVRWEVAQEVCEPLKAASPDSMTSQGTGRLARLLAHRLWLWLASANSPASSGSIANQARYLGANIASYDTPRAALQRLGVVAWPVQDMADQSLGSRGNRHPWLYVVTAPVHIPRRMARKSRPATPLKAGKSE